MVRRRRGTAVAAAGFALAVLCCLGAVVVAAGAGMGDDDGGSVRPSASSGPVVYAMGETAEVTDGSKGSSYLVTVSYSGTCVAASGSYEVFDVSVEVASGMGYINPVYFVYVSRSGSVREYISGAYAGCARMESENWVPAGETMSGTLAFSDPEGAGGWVRMDQVNGVEMCRWSFG